MLLHDVADELEMLEEELLEEELLDTSSSSELLDSSS